MANFSGSANFATTGGAAGYRLDVNVTTTEVSGGTQLYVTASATRIRFDLTPAFSSSGSRSYNVPGGRTNSTSGGLLESGSATWSYDFRNSNTQTVWGGFYRYIPYSYGTSTTVTITAAGSGSSFLLSTSVAVPVTLFEEVQTTTVPNILNQYYVTAYNNIINAGLSSNITGTVQTSNASLDGLVASQNPSGGTVVNLGSTVSWSYYTYVAPTWTVTFNRNGRGSTTTTSVTDGNSVTLPSAPTRSGYTFSGWLSSYNGGVYGANTSSHAIFGNTTFTAQWTVIQYTISFEENGGAAVSNITGNVNSTVPLPTTTRSGFSFGGWYTNAALTGSSYTSWTIVGNQTLYAKWISLAPGFEDDEVSQSLLLNQDISTAPDSSVFATNATSYSIAYGGAGLNPTPWLSIDNSGNLSGSTNVVGTYYYIINATGEGGTTPSNLKSLTVSYPGKRIDPTATPTNLTTVQRYDGLSWTPVTSMKRFNGTSWIDITN